MYKADDDHGAYIPPPDEYESVKEQIWQQHLREKLKEAPPKKRGEKAVVKIGSRRRELSYP